MNDYALWAVEVVDLSTGGHVFDCFGTRKEADAFASEKEKRGLSCYVWKM